MEPAWRLLSERVAWSSLGESNLQTLAHEDQLDLVHEDAFFVLDGLLDRHDLVNSHYRLVGLQVHTDFLACQELRQSLLPSLRSAFLLA
jgi:hypothetical protein